MNKIGSHLCRAYAHGKGHKVSFAVRIRTAKMAGCAPGNMLGRGCDPGHGLCRAGLQEGGRQRACLCRAYTCEADGNAGRLCRGAGLQADGKARGHGSLTAHGNPRAHGRAALRTATSQGTAAPNGARQRLCRAISAVRTAKEPLPVASLPCCRCRAEPHGNGVAETESAVAVRTGRTGTRLSPVMSAPEFGM